MADAKLAPDTLVHQRYRVVRAVGKGGMGAVYEAVDERLGHRVALKQTLVDGEVAERAFEREARLLASLRHPALPAVSDFFAEGDGRFLVMQYIPGRTLAELAQERGGPFPVDQVLHWAEALLRALDHLHSRQPPILHRDIKPANLKLTAEGEVILLDFGLAKGSGETTSTGPSVYGLTPQYAPLEQFHGSGTEPCSDLFSLAGTLYFLLTHVTPPDALTRASHVGMGKPDPIRPAAEINPEVPGRASAWLARAMAIHKEDRFSTAREMLRALDEIRTGITEALPETVPAVAAPTVPFADVARATALSTKTAPPGHRARSGRGWLPLAAGALALLLLVGIGLVVAWRLLAGGDAPAKGPHGAKVEYVDGEGLEFRWPGADYWVVMRGEERLVTHQRTATAKVAPGTYTIVPNSGAPFEPVQVVVKAGRKAVLTLPAGRLEVRWAGKDFWKLLRGGEQVALLQGTATSTVIAGRYRIEPHSDQVFEPQEVTVGESGTTTAEIPSGTLDLRWAGKDYWKILRGGEQVALQHGTARRLLSPGRYRVEPHSEPVFEPLEFEVRAGETSVVAPPAGTLEVRWTGKGVWRLVRGDATMYVAGSATRVVAPGAYRIEPSGTEFSAVEFTVEEGRTTVVELK
ncbi:MAG TPA: serine/threonine-protein kinase [Vicinamibacteria bacterium]|nr:serine/threonine-protein kinase [Vicinamibacteria bacterium]